MTFSDGQILYRQSLVLYWHAVITSGQYKTRMWMVDDRQVTEAEKLQHCLEIMQNHCRLLGDAAQNLPADKPAPGYEVCTMCGVSVRCDEIVRDGGLDCCRPCFTSVPPRDADSNLRP
jgi:hypothetical protein